MNKTLSLKYHNEARILNIQEDLRKKVNFSWNFNTKPICQPVNIYPWKYKENDAIWASCSTLVNHQQHILNLNPDGFLNG